MECLAQESVKENKKVEWSLKPILVCMKFLGIQLPPHANLFSMAIFARVFSCIVFLANLLFNGQMVLYCFYIVQSGFQPTDLPKSTMENNQTINSFNEPTDYPPYPDPYLAFEKYSQAQTIANYFIISICFTFVPLIHLYFLSTVFFTRLWEDFWTRCILIQRNFNLSTIFYQKCHKRCFTAIFILILVIISLQKLDFLLVLLILKINFVTGLFLFLLEIYLLGYISWQKLKV